MKSVKHQLTCTYGLSLYGKDVTYLYGKDVTYEVGDKLEMEVYNEVWSNLANVLEVVSLKEIRKI